MNKKDSKLLAASNLPQLFKIRPQLQKDQKGAVRSIAQKKQLIRKEGFKPIYNVVVIGHVDSGKSTTVGRLLYDCGFISPHVLEQYKKQAAAEDKQSFAFAWILDKTSAQRKRGITIDLAHAEWQTPGGRYFTIIDAPGHSDFIKNMITGTSQADLGILLVDTKKGLVESDITEEHAFLLRASGVTSIIVALNKFNLIQDVSLRMGMIKDRMDEISAVLKRCGFAPSDVIFCPVNSYQGWNVLSKQHNSVELPGYEGPSLVEALDQINLPAHAVDLPLRISVENIFKQIDGTNCVITGKIMSGILCPGETVSVRPARVTGVVGGIEMHHKKLSYATPGCNVGIDLKKIDASNITKASIISDPSDRPAKAIDSFVVKNALIKTHPSQISIGSNLIVHYQTGNVCCEVTGIKDVRNLSTGEFKQGPQQFVTPGSLATLSLKADKPIVLETVTEHPRNSRVMLRDSNKTIGFGVVSETTISKFEV